MFNARMENIGNLAIIECEGSILLDDAACSLREAITANEAARIIVMDLSELTAIQGPGLSMLVFLQRWAHDHRIQLKLFNPSSFVRHKLENASSIYDFDISSLHEVMALLNAAETHHPLAA